MNKSQVQGWLDLAQRSMRFAAKDLAHGHLQTAAVDIMHARKNLLRARRRLLRVIGAPLSKPATESAARDVWDSVTWKR